MKFWISAFALVLGQTLSSNAFELNMDAQELDDLTSTIRASDLAVNDIAYFSPWDFCRRDGRLFLPSTEVPTDSDDTYRFLLKVSFGPSKQLTATSVPPTKEGEFTEDDIFDFAEALFEPSHIFLQNDPFCKDAGTMGIRPVQFYPLVSIDGFNNLSDLVRDLKQRWKW